MIARLTQHHFNSLHMMARLVRWGLPRRRALLIAQKWERFAHPWLYRN